MSRRKRELTPEERRDYRDAKNARHRTKESPGTAHISRRALLTGAGVTIGAALAYPLYQMYQKMRDGLDQPGLFRENTDAALQKGDIVFDESNNTPDRLFLSWKQVHHGPSLVKQMQLYPDIFDAYVNHQLAMRDVLQKHLECAGPERIRFFFEGFSHQPGQLNAEERADLSEAADIDVFLSQPPRKEALLRHIRQKVLTGDPEAVNFLAVLNGAGLFLTHCEKQNLPITFGTEPKGHESLQDRFHKKIRPLVEKKSPADAELEEFIQWFRAAEEEDQRSRHTHISGLLDTHVPKGGIGIVVLGANHFGAGAQYDGAGALLPLEKFLGKIPHSRTVIMDEKHLPSLVQKRAGMILINSKDLTIEGLRGYIGELRNDR